MLVEKWGKVSGGWCLQIPLSLSHMVALCHVPACCMRFWKGSCADVAAQAAWLAIALQSCGAALSPQGCSVILLADWLRETPSCHGC